MRIKTGRMAVFVICVSVFAACSTSGLSSKRTASSKRPSLTAGTYTLILDATYGSRKGASTRGTLHLVESRSDDRSPETGKTPWPQWEHLYPLWGWVEIDLNAVGAPVISGASTSPNSRDPITPGVLVYQGSTPNGSPAPAPVLRIGTVGQTRNPVIESTDSGDLIEVSTDGSGIGLRVKKVNAKGFKGTWSESGIIVDGRGTFWAKRQDPPASDLPQGEMRNQ